MEDYLHKLVNVMAHHLVGRNTRDFFHLPGSKELIGMAMAVLTSDQTLAPTFSFPLLATFYLF